ncbi:hypothetical protein GF420_06160 [candidate division GN15 bacterium]|nr:hypothetical protein [candidate division GN15 bacterium]
MPGIFGFICKETSDTARNQWLIDSMLARLSHHDEYTGEVWADDWCAVGNVGLPIAGERRFVHDPERNGVAAFSGYIYDWKDDTGSGGEPTDKAGRLLGVYRAVGEKFVEKIDGSFNAVVVDTASKRILLGNDRMGHRALYYYEDDRYVLFSTEYKAFLAYDRFDRAVDNRAIADYFNFSYVLGDATFFKKVKRLPGGHVVTLTPEQARFSRYWDFHFPEESRQSIPELVDELDAIYRGVIRKQIGDNTEIILPLSGGLDSRFIVAHVMDMGRQPHCYTHGVPGCLDYEIAVEVARALQIRHYDFVDINPHWFVENHDRFVHLTEGMVFANPSMLLGIGAQYDLPRKSAFFANGIFGGPTNFGSAYFRAYDIVESISHEEKLANLRRSLFGESITDESYLKFHPSLREHVQKQYMTSLEEEFARHTGISEHFHHQKDVFFIRNRLVRFMNQVDCNRYGWHDHFVLYDDRLLDFYLRLPARVKCSRKFFSEYFKIKLPELARIAYQATGVNLYETPTAWQLRKRRWKKQFRYYTERLSMGTINLYNLETYYQYDQWFRTHRPLREFVESLLLDQKTLERGYLDRTGIENLLKRERRGGDGFSELSSMTALESWFRQFVDS